MIDIIFEKKGAVTVLVENWIKNNFENFVIDFITALPIIIGVSVGVYALLNMISHKLAKFGVGAVFIYGSLITVF